MKTKTVVKSPELGEASINIIENDPTAIKNTKNVKAFLSVAILVMNKHKMHPTNSAISELRRLAYTSPVPSSVTKKGIMKNEKLQNDHANIMTTRLRRNTLFAQSSDTVPLSY